MNRQKAGLLLAAELKPVVMYTAFVRPLVLGRGAWVKVVYHSVIPATGEVTTSPVVKIGTLFTKTGPRFETLNTLYVPADYLDEGVLVYSEQQEKETEDG